MKAKLIKKKEDWYNLYQDSIGIASTHEELQGYKLSLKNCQAIERGYDLYELIDHITPKDKLTVNVSERRNGFLKGFQKCLELMGDKKFSEEDMRKAVSRARMCSVIDEYGSIRFHEGDVEIIQSLKQTEWEVEIEMEQVYDGLDEMAQPQYHKQPKLDADGCLILKVKSE